jgi:hypothetical protein
MISSNLTQLLGLTCNYMDDAGTVAEIGTPFVFPDGDPFPVYVQQVGEILRFFDDGDVISHFMAQVPLDAWHDCKFIEESAKPYGVLLNDEGELEIRTDAEHAPAAFARYISAMFALASWEQRQETLAWERRGVANAARTDAQVDSPAPLSA